jgi:hypothetical protein
MTYHSPAPRLSDAAKTFLVLFGYDKGKMSGFLKAYDGIDMPLWYCCQSTEPHPSVKMPKKPTCGDVEAHLRTQAWYGKLPVKVPYSDFGRFEKRLRALDW